jgi:hypothetical protein
MTQIALVQTQGHSRDRRDGARSTPDYALLLNRLELLVSQGQDLEKAEGYLRRETVWKALPPDQAMSWSRLAQSAGLPDLALEVLAWLNRTRPEVEEAWRNRRELLELLGRRDEAAQVLAVGRLDGGTVGRWDGGTVGQLDGGTVERSDGISDAASHGLTDPFVRQRREDRAIERYMEYFQGREECFARQWIDKQAGTQGYVPERRPLTSGDVQEHLQGRKTYGIYLLQEDSQVRLAVIDADIHQRLREGRISAADREQFRREQTYLLTRLPELAREAGLPCLTEFSGGKGYHFWFFFSEAVPAALPRQALHRLTTRMAQDLTLFNLEVFPKQDELRGKGLGNLVKLPLGLHRVTGKASHFVGVRDRSLPAQLAVLETMDRISIEALEQAAGTPATSAQVLVHPRHQAWAESWPELALLGERCPALGQIFASCRASRTLSVREEKILLGSISFLPRGKALLHHLFQNLPEYNPALTDYKLSKVRGTPLGCKRIHGLLNMTLDQCSFENVPSYPHPLLHVPDWEEGRGAVRAERIENLQAALENLETAMTQVKRFLS